MIPSTDTIHRAAEILRQIEALQAELAGLFTGGSVVVATKRRGRPPGPGKASANRAPGKRRGPRTMSPEARAKIAAAQKARWVKFRANMTK